MCGACTDAHVCICVCVCACVRAGKCVSTVLSLCSLLLPVSLIIILLSAFGVYLPSCHIPENRLGAWHLLSGSQVLLNDRASTKIAVSHCLHHERDKEECPNLDHIDDEPANHDVWRLPGFETCCAAGNTCIQPCPAKLNGPLSLVALCSLNIKRLSP